MHNFQYNGKNVEVSALKESSYFKYEATNFAGLWQVWEYEGFRDFPDSLSVEVYWRSYLQDANGNNLPGSTARGMFKVIPPEYDFFFAIAGSFGDITRKHCLNGIMAQVPELDGNHQREGIRAFGNDMQYHEPVRFTLTKTSDTAFEIASDNYPAPALEWKAANPVTGYDSGWQTGAAFDCPAEHHGRIRVTARSGQARGAAKYIELSTAL